MIEKKLELEFREFENSVQKIISNIFKFLRVYNDKETLDLFKHFYSQLSDLKLKLRSISHSLMCGEEVKKILEMIDKIEYSCAICKNLEECEKFPCDHNTELTRKIDEELNFLMVEERKSRNLNWDINEYTSLLEIQYKKIKVLDDAKFNTEKEVLTKNKIYAVLQSLRQLKETL